MGNCKYMSGVFFFDDFLLFHRVMAALVLFGVLICLFSSLIYGFRLLSWARSRQATTINEQQSQKSIRAIYAFILGAVTAALMAALLICFYCSFGTSAGPMAAFWTGLQVLTAVAFIGAGVVLSRSKESVSEKDLKKMTQFGRFLFLSTPAWALVVSFIFFSMYLYVPLSIYGLLVLGVYSILDLGRKTSKKSNDKPSLRAFVGASALSVGFFALIGLFYRYAFLEGWYYLSKHLIATIAFIGIGLSLLSSDKREAPKKDDKGRQNILKSFFTDRKQMAFGVLAIACFAWRAADTAHSVPILSESLIRIGDDFGGACGYKYTNSQVNLVPFGILSNSSETKCADRSPVIWLSEDEIIFDRWGNSIDLKSIEIDQAMKKLSAQIQEKIDISVGHPAYGLTGNVVLGIDRDTQWGLITEVVSVALEHGQNSLSFLFKSKSGAFLERPTGYRMESRILENIQYADPAEKSVLCARKLDQAALFCPKIAGLDSLWNRLNTKGELAYARRGLIGDLISCWGDTDIDALVAIYWCMLHVDPVNFASFSLADKDTDGVRTISMPANITWRETHKEVVLYPLDYTKSRQPIRLEVTQKSAGK